MYSILKRILFQFQPEFIHEIVIRLLQHAGKVPGLLNVIEKYLKYHDPRLTVQIGNLTFPNPIGLAAGFDKNGEAISGLQALGFGHLEVGTITPLAQSGNPKPRLFRLKEDKALINRMGFNNRGVDYLTKQISGKHLKIPIGINLGKNKNTSIESAAEDYLIGLKKAWQYGDYFTINISSPNTENLRNLQQQSYLEPLIEKIMTKRDQLSDETNQFKPIWLKIAPDLSESELKEIIDVALSAKIDALIVTNTTITRPNLLSNFKNETGGLSGKPLSDISDLALGTVCKVVKGKIPVIGVGGIFQAEDVYRKLTLGANMVQVYTGFIFEGPDIVKQINMRLIRLMDQNNILKISDITM
ncbi:MAG: quinone-dependent dihydroorotate dehydrogenase [Deltaproteobacteria bacterium]|nr:quinone-dependent dihydroorotate dehydrogenase [Deltaproteobacteria bacterium]MBT4527547.1 quinone-dependent dihydroorotate dehydrogenase [Deltaproteobacteria bacterium]